MKLTFTKFCSIYGNKKEEAIKYVLDNYSRSMIAKKLGEILEKD